MKYFKHVDKRVIENWCRVYKYDKNRKTVIVNIMDNLNGEVFRLYSQALTCGFIEVVTDHNDHQDYEFKLSEEGEAYITFLLL